MPGADPKRVILFGLSANPPTGLGGHAGIVRWAATPRPLEAFDGHIADQVWVLPVYVHAYRQKRDMPSFAHRMAMAKLAFEALPGLEDRVFVSDVERRAAEVSSSDVRVGTVDVLDLLETEHPQTRWALLLGTDTYEDLWAGRWKDSERLLERVPIIVIPRKGLAKPDQSAVDAPDLSEVSSSAVRSSRDPEVWRRAVQPPVFDYILRNGLYGFGASGSED